VRSGGSQFLFPTHRLVLAGFSLGGNFMLRVAAEAPRVGLRIDRAFGVSPVLDPARCLDALENGWSLYHDYFVRKWTRSLRLKQRAWPGQFEFGGPARVRATCGAMTRELVARPRGLRRRRRVLPRLCDHG
jgi:predicted alpha/beta-fold hydrolase